MDCHIIVITANVRCLSFLMFMKILFCPIFDHILVSAIFGDRIFHIIIFFFRNYERDALREEI